MSAEFLNSIGRFFQSHSPARSNNCRLSLSALGVAGGNCKDLLDVLPPSLVCSLRLMTGASPF